MKNKNSHNEKYKPKNTTKYKPKKITFGLATNIKKQAQSAPTEPDEKVGLNNHHVKLAKLLRTTLINAKKIRPSRAGTFEQDMKLLINEVGLNDAIKVTTKFCAELESEPKGRLSWVYSAKMFMEHFYKISDILSKPKIPMIGKLKIGPEADLIFKEVSLIARLSENVPVDNMLQLIQACFENVNKFSKKASEVIQLWKAWENTNTGTTYGAIKSTSDKAPNAPLGLPTWFVNEFRRNCLIIDCPERFIAEVWLLNYIYPTIHKADQKASGWKGSLSKFVWHQEHPRFYEMVARMGDESFKFYNYYLNYLQQNV